MSLRGIDVFFKPRGVAIIGAARESFKPGHVILRNFLENMINGVFSGELYAVNPNVDRILGLKCYRSIRNIDGIVDLSVIAIPAKLVPEVLEECGERNLRGAIIISSGFKEVGNDGLEEEIKRISRRYGIRVIGPNCLGVYDAYTGVDTIFLQQTRTIGGSPVLATPRPKPGPIAIITQSGAIGAAILDYMSGVEMGISKFVSYGNKVDVDEVDLIDYLKNDEKTRVITLYIESIDRGVEFIDVASNVSLKKPIVAMKAGRSEGGARAAASHTGALAGTYKIYEAAFKQSGVVLVQTLEELMDCAKALAYQPPAPEGNVVIVTDGGGAGIMAVDTLESLGIRVDILPEDLLKKFEEMKKKNIIPAFAAIRNPIDLTGIATAEMYTESLKILIQNSWVNCILIIALHHIPTLEGDFPDKLIEVCRESTKPIIACDIGEAEMSKRVRSRLEKAGIPAYQTPERAAMAAWSLIKYGKHIRKLMLETVIKSIKPAQKS
ncbi:MAG: CoA-binding protein [Candidatus Methanomethylicia archaeon]